MSNAAIAAVALASLAVCPMPTGPGPLVVWSSSAPVHQEAPAEDFLALAAGGLFQTLAIKADGTLYLTEGPADPADSIPSIPVALQGIQVTAVGLGRTTAMAIRADGSIVTWGRVASAMDGVPTTGVFQAVTGSALYSLALDTSGNIVMWGGSELLPLEDRLKIMNPPTGISFQAIAARGRYALALATDGNIYGWGVAAGIFDGPNSWTSDNAGHFIAPFEPGKPYTAIAAGLSPAAGSALIVALRDNGHVVAWDPSGLLSAAPAGGGFKKIAAGSAYAMAIDQDDHLTAWGIPERAAYVAVPAGVYSSISAGTGRASAIAISETTPPVVSDLTLNHDSIWPPNHKMTTVALTFRADDDCSPVALSRLSVTLGSNQPDNGSGSGNTTGDTNGQDGYTALVALPTSAIVRNADGSFTATFQVRAEESNALPGPRIYTVSVVATDNATPPNTSAPMTTQIVVGHGGQ